jgi:hypothetical protein
MVSITDDDVDDEFLKYKFWYSVYSIRLFCFVLFYALRPFLINCKIVKLVKRFTICIFFTVKFDSLLV